MHRRAVNGKNHQPVLHQNTNGVRCITRTFPVQKKERILFLPLITAHSLLCFPQIPSVCPRPYSRISVRTPQLQQPQIFMSSHTLRTDQPYNLHHLRLKACCQTSASFKPVLWQNTLSTSHPSHLTIRQAKNSTRTVSAPASPASYRAHRISFEPTNILLLIRDLHFLSYSHISKIDVAPTQSESSPTISFSHVLPAHCQHFTISIPRRILNTFYSH